MNEWMNELMNDSSIDSFIHPLNGWMAERMPESFNDWMGEQIIVPFIDSLTNSVSLTLFVRAPMNPCRRRVHDWTDWLDWTGLDWLVLPASQGREKHRNHGTRGFRERLWLWEYRKTVARLSQDCRKTFPSPPGVSKKWNTKCTTMEFNFTMEINTMNDNI